MPICRKSAVVFFCVFHERNQHRNRIAHSIKLISKKIAPILKHLLLF
ncbi:hypothetical protein HMPREF9996_02030 [Aggregatibacter actinomycetemcomitans Y4]|nr:hypothetical protein CF65_02965 [Aggregatibacter actinomycetemcomitans HK1651]EKX93955.1 hypothetical protein HMPREF9996_02030 [Aggregatibacter actinomycetemcomitans Y4]